MTGKVVERDTESLVINIFDGAEEILTMAENTKNRELERDKKTKIACQP